MQTYIYTHTRTHAAQTRFFAAVLICLPFVFIVSHSFTLDRIYSASARSAAQNGTETDVVTAAQAAKDTQTHSHRHTHTHVCL